MATLGIVSIADGGFMQRMEGLLADDAAFKILEERLDAQAAAVLACAGCEEELARLLAEPIARLSAAGADHALVASVSAHCARRALEDVSVLPLVDLAEALRQDVFAAGWRTVFLLGSYRTMKDGFLKRPLILAHTIVITPSEDEKLWLQKIHDAELKDGKERQAVQERLLAIARKGAEEGAQGLLLASTVLEEILEGAELPLPAITPASAAAHALAAR